MDFVAVVDQAIALLRQRGRVSYRTLQLQYQLDEAHLEALKDEVLYAHPEIHDDAGRGLVWTPAAPACTAEATARFDAVLVTATALLRAEKRVTYRFLTHACGLDEAFLKAVLNPPKPTKRLVNTLRRHRQVVG